MSTDTPKVVRFHYTVSEVGQPPTESSREGEPLAVLLGTGSLIPGMEKALVGRAAGDRFELTVPCDEAYGPRDEALTQRIPKKYFPDPDHLKAGQTTVLQTRQGPRPVKVMKVGMSVVDVDLNHPMAGKDLHFDLEVVEVRDATAEEIDHGHVHGEGGHHH